jgi:hypothetical protein
MDIISSEFKLNFEFLPRLWKIAQQDLGGILIWGFFINYSRLSKDFRKIQYIMPCNASWARLILEKIFICKVTSFFVTYMQG